MNQFNLFIYVKLTMAHQNIEDLPQDIKRELVTTLDNRNSSTGNWRALIKLMPPVVIYQRSQIESFAMATLQPHGSPTRALLADLSFRGITVPQLIMWISQLQSRTHSHQLQSLLTVLQQSMLFMVLMQGIKLNELECFFIGGTCEIKSPWKL